MAETISFVFPVWNEEGNVEPLYAEVRKACDTSQVGYEMIFVDDGSTDNSLRRIKELARQDDHVQYLSLSRNFGHQNALFAGMAHASGDAVMTMDADLQHPPSLIPFMVGLWREGVEVVYTTKRTATNIPRLRVLCMQGFYWLMSRLAGMRLQFGQSDFRLLDRAVVDVLLRLPEHQKFLRGQVWWVGFKQQGVSYEVADRHSGSSKLPYHNRFSFALDGLFAFSTYPLHLVTMAGIGIATLSCAYIAYICARWALQSMGLARPIPFAPGWVTIIVAIGLLGSLQLIGLGIVGAYLGRVYDQTKQRPIFIVREASDACRERVSQHV